VAEVFSLLGGFFPDSVIRASTLDEFVAALLDDPRALGSLPVVTQEVGDTWVYGALLLLCIGLLWLLTGGAFGPNCAPSASALCACLSGAQHAWSPIRSVRACRRHRQRPAENCALSGDDARAARAAALHAADACPEEFHPHAA